MLNSDKTKKQKTYELYMDILRNDSLTDQLVSLGEEAGEVNLAALKLLRSNGIGPMTDKSRDECLSHLLEELSDLQIMFRLIRRKLDDVGLCSTEQFDETMLDVQCGKWERKIERVWKDLGGNMGAYMKQMELPVYERKMNRCIYDLFSSIYHISITKIFVENEWKLEIVISGKRQDNKVANELLNSRDGFSFIICGNISSELLEEVIKANNLEHFYVNSDMTMLTAAKVSTNIGDVQQIDRDIFLHNYKQFEKERK